MLLPTFLVLAVVVDTLPGTMETPIGRRIYGQKPIQKQSAHGMRNELEVSER
jgi:hypothetical protein